MLRQARVWRGGLCAQGGGAHPARPPAGARNSNLPDTVPRRGRPFEPSTGIQSQCWLVGLWLALLGSPSRHHSSDRIASPPASAHLGSVHAGAHSGSAHAPRARADRHQVVLQVAVPHFVSLAVGRRCCAMADRRTGAVSGIRAVEGRVSPVCHLAPARRRVSAGQTV